MSKVYKNDKFVDSIDHSKISIKDKDDIGIQGINKHSSILVSLNGEYKELRKIYRSPLRNDSPDINNLGVSISNMNANSFLDFQINPEPLKIHRVGQFVQTIKLIFDDGYLICSPWTEIFLSDNRRVYAKDLTSFDPILGYKIINDKMIMESKYVKDMEEYSYIDRVYNVECVYGNIAIALNEDSGIFIPTIKY